MVLRQSEPGVAAFSFDPAETIESLRDERNLLAQRAINADYTWVGISSNAMVVHAIFGLPVPCQKFPYDWGDYARCVNTYHRSPEHLRPAMLRCLAQYREFVASRYPDRQPVEWMEADPVV